MTTYTKDLVSVIVPTYNDAPYLPLCLEDLRDQTYGNLEIIIVNDGSTDGTPEILEQCAERDKRIQIFNKPNGGTGSALNYGSQHVHGEYSTWVSSDDRRISSCIDELLAHAQEHGAEYIVSAYHSERFNRDWRAYVPDPRGFPQATTGFSHDGKPSGLSFVVDNWPDLNYTRCHSGVSFLFKSTLKDRCGPYLEIPGEDYYMSVKMGILSKKTVYLDKVLGTHCSPPDSLTSAEGVKVTYQAEHLTRQLILDWKRSL